MLVWWNSLSLIAQIFYCMAIPATLLLLIQTVLLFLGLDDEGGDTAPDGGADSAGDGVFDADGDPSPEDPSGLADLNVLTLRGIVAFFVVFGWVGAALEGSGAALYVTLAAAFLSGLATMFGLAFLMRAVLRLRASGNTDNRNAVGTAGKVYLTIPPARSGAGKVQIMLQGAYRERNAVTDEAEPIPTGAEVVVIGLSGETDLLVKRK